MLQCLHLSQKPALLLQAQAALAAGRHAVACCRGVACHPVLIMQMCHLAQATQAVELALKTRKKFLAGMQQAFASSDCTAPRCWACPTCCRTEACAAANRVQSTRCAEQSSEGTPETVSAAHRLLAERVCKVDTVHAQSHLPEAGSCLQPAGQQRSGRHMKKSSIHRNYLPPARDRPCQSDAAAALQQCLALQCSAGSIFWVERRLGVKTQHCIMLWERNTPVLRSPCQQSFCRHDEDEGEAQQVMACRRLPDVDLPLPALRKLTSSTLCPSNLSSSCLCTGASAEEPTAMLNLRCRFCQSSSSLQPAGPLQGHQNCSEGLGCTSATGPQHLSDNRSQSSQPLRSIYNGAVSVGREH